MMTIPAGGATISARNDIVHGTHAVLDATLRFTVRQTENATTMYDVVGQAGPNACCRYRASGSVDTAQAA